jgi:hypothetical protein
MAVWLLSSLRKLQLTHFSAELYNALYQLVLSRPDVAELTVEDPAEAFEDLRDRNDLKMLLGHERFMREAWGEEAVSHGGGRVSRKFGKSAKRPVKAQGKLWPPVDKPWVEQWRVELKMAKVLPGSRCVESSPDACLLHSGNFNDS